MQPVQESKVSVQSSFQSALSLQQQKKYVEAVAAYKSILNENPDLSPSQVADISYNAALSSFLQKDFLHSFVFNQKALILQPDHKPAQQLAEKIKTDFQVRALPHEISLTENLNKVGFKYIPLEIFWILATLFFVLFLKGVLNFYVIRKKEILENLNFSSFSWKNYIWLILFILFSSLTGLNILDQQTPKALINVEQANLKTAAGENQASLTDIPGGSLIYILRTAKIGDIFYYQVKYPGGVSGWLKKDDLEVISMPKD